jgi:hypothetical protein
MRILQIAYECMCGKSFFYEQLGEDVVLIRQKAIELLKKMNTNNKTNEKSKDSPNRP